MRNWYSIKAAATETEVMIYDEIGGYGVTAKQFVEDFGSINTPSIKVRINSPGGDVFDGFAIYNAIKAKGDAVSIQVDGVAASIASVIALAGKTCAMCPNSYLMIHKPYSVAMGTDEDMLAQAALLEKIGNTLAGVYAAKCGKTAPEMMDVMKAETWYTADEAKAAGFADCILTDAAELPNGLSALLKYHRTPEPLKVAALAKAESILSPVPSPEDAAIQNKIFMDSLEALAV